MRSLWYTLTADERQRAERYVFEQDRTHFVVARGLLRVLLGRYLRQDPPHLRFIYGPHGKPALATDTGGGPCASTFPTLTAWPCMRSHAVARWGLMSKASGPKSSRRRLPSIFFLPREVTVLRALPTPLQATAFFACWTRKEAYIKAKGEGLSLPLDQFAVSLAPGEPAALLHTAWDPQEAACWALQDLAPAPGYRAAVAVAGHDWHLTCWDGPVAYLDVSNAPHVASQEAPRQTGGGK